jgi:predicted metal-dependent hydrolase
VTSRKLSPKRSAESPSVDELYEEGIELFNRGLFFECHEAWEEVWKRSAGAEKLFYQGLIQAAVAILHAQRGNRDGARSLYAKARAKLDPLPAHHVGIALGKLRSDLREFFAKALTGSTPIPPAPRLRRS